jgi:hypothetical protein
MLWLSRHLIAVAIVGVAVASVGAVFAFARPAYRPYVMPSAPKDLPYTAVTYTVADVRQAFAADDLHIGLNRSTAGGVGITSFSAQSDVLEVDVFGDPQQVKDSGFSDYFTFVDGHWVKAPRTCGPGDRNAERWHGNVRVIVSCARAGSASKTWLRRVELALGRL